MKIYPTPLIQIIFFVIVLALMSATGKENLYGNFSAVYSDNDYIVLKKNTNKVFMPNPGFGKLIRDSVAEAEIKLYREKNPGATRYIDFNFNSILGYVGSFQNVENAIDNSRLGIRIYPAIDLETKQLSVIISPTRDDQSLWKNKKLINGRTIDLDVEAFNTGSMCPVACPDGDTTNIPK